MMSHAFLLYEMQAIVASQIEEFVKFPPRQKPASFNLDAGHGAVAGVDKQQGPLVGAGRIRRGGPTCESWHARTVGPRFAYATEWERWRVCGSLFPTDGAHTSRAMG